MLGVPIPAPVPAPVGCASSLVSAAAGQTLREPFFPGTLDQARRVLARHSLHSASGEELTAAAVQGMFRAVRDPYGRYLPIRDFEQLLSEAEGMYVGVGVEIRVTGGQILLDPIPGGPAARAGVQRGSVLTAVDGRPLRPVAAEAAQRALSGPPGATVRMSVREPGRMRVRVYAVLRGEVRMHPVRARILNGGLGYLEIREFSRGSGQEAVDAASVLMSEHPPGLILDLRGNPGGFLDEALTFLDAVARRGATAHINYRDRMDVVEHAPGPGLPVPLIILVDRDSASAAELVASSLRERNGAKLVGQRTFGKAYLQEIAGLGSGGGLIYTVARVEDARGRSWQGRGLVPDVAADEDQAFAAATRLLHHTQSGPGLRRR